MQAISKIEQPTSPSSNSNYYYSPPNSTKDLMQSITKILENGQQSALQVRNILNKRLGFKVKGDATCDDDLDHHTCVTLSSFETCLSMIKSFDLDHFSDDHDLMMINKRKLDHTSTITSSDDVECSDHSSKSHEIVDGGPKVSRERRGCYKRRRNGQSWTMEATNLVDDGFAWRKYGQKEILNTKYPRNYFRCTHKHDQECQATKQVQQTSENPTKYTIIYHGHHTCKNLLKTPSIIIDNSQEENSSFYLSFDTKTHPPSKHALSTPSLLFPSSSSSSSAYHNNNIPTIVKQEPITPFKIEPPLAPHDLGRDRDHDHRVGAHIQHQYSSSSDNHPPSSSVSDLTSTGISSTPVSEQGDSVDEFYPNMDDEELFNLINMNSEYPLLDDGFWNNLCAQ